MLLLFFVVGVLVLISIALLLVEREQAYRIERLLKCVEELTSIADKHSNILHDHTAILKEITKRDKARLSG